MHRPIPLLLAASLILAGCSGWSNSRVNPANWFRAKTPTPASTPAEGGANPLMPASTGSNLLARPAPEDRSVPIARVTVLRVEPTPSGAIVYAEGVAERQGPYQTELRPIPPAEGDRKNTLSLSFRVVYPVNPTDVGNERSRTVHEALTLSRKELAGIRTIRVTGQENTLQTRRR